MAAPASQPRYAGAVFMRPELKIRVGDWLVEPRRNRLSREGDEQRLEPLTMNVLAYLLERSGKVVSTEELLSQVWAGRPIHRAAVKKRIGQIRSVLGDSVNNPRYISTIPKRGYCLIAPVEAVDTRKDLQTASAFPNTEASGSADELRSIAVLPLKNLSNDPDQQYVADGLTEEVITELARIRDLRVISRSSMMRYRNGGQSLPQIAKALDVDFVVEGSVAREGKRFRVTLHLIDAHADRHVWGHTYDTNVSTILGLRSALARDLAAQLDLELSGDERAGFTDSREYDEAAFDAYLRGVSNIGSSEQYNEWSATAIDYLQRAVALDPDFAEAWSHLALLEVIPAVWISRDRFATVEEYAEKALSIDGRLPAAHTAVGYVRLLRDWDLADARSAFTQALALSPNEPKSLHGYMIYLRVQGEITEALQVATKLARLSPHNVHERAERAKCLYDARLYEDAINEVRSIQVLEPGFHSLYESRAYFRLGRFEDSYRARIAFYKSAGSEFDAVRAAAIQGWEEGGYESMLQALLHHQEPEFPESDRYWNHAQVGELDKAFSDLETLAKNRSPWFVGIRPNPNFDVVRLDRRFDTLLERVGLPALAEDPPMMADLGRLMAFRGRAAEAVDRLHRAMTASPDDRRLPYWMESMAWAQFAMVEYAQALEWAGRALEHSISPHAAAFAHLLRASSFTQLGDLEAAQSAFAEAQDCWPTSLQIDRDIKPLFLGGDKDMRTRYVAGLRKAMP